MLKRLQAVEDGTCKRLMIFMPPGSAKSTYASEMMPPHYIGRYPQRCIITASYGKKLSLRFGKRCRNHVSSEIYHRAFGFGLARGSTAKDEWETERGGEYVATAVDGSITGRRADLILIDDPVKGRREADSIVIRDACWDWYLADVRSRLKPNGAIVIIMTRWHEDDLAGRILPPDYKGESGIIAARDGEEWEVVSIRAQAEEDDPLGRAVGDWLWPEWFVPGMLEREKISQGPRNWNALYQQRPAPEEGDYFKREWLRWCEKIPARETLKVYGASDYAVTSDGGDFTVHIVVGVDPNDDIYILDLWRGQTSTDIWIDRFIDLVKRWRPIQWAVEKGQIEKSVGPFLRKRMREEQKYVWPSPFPSTADKAVRAQSIRGRVAMGKVYIPKSAPWAAPLVAEMMAFPTGTFDDQVDTLSLIGQLLDSMVKGKAPPPKEIRGVSDMTMKQAWKMLAKKAAAENRRRAERGG